MYAASEYRVGDRGKPVKVAQVIVAKYMSAAEGITWSPKTLSIRAGDADDKAANSMAGKRHKNDGFIRTMGGASDSW